MFLHEAIALPPDTYFDAQSLLSGAAECQTQLLFGRATRSVGQNWPAGRHPCRDESTWTCCELSVSANDPLRVCSLLTWRSKSDDRIEYHQTLIWRKTLVVTSSRSERAAAAGALAQVVAARAFATRSSAQHNLRRTWAKALEILAAGPNGGLAEVAQVTRGEIRGCEPDGLNLGGDGTGGKGEGKVVKRERSREQAKCCWG